MYTIVPDSNGHQLPLAIVQYSFLDGKAVPIRMKSHANAKHDRPYMRTQQSTLEDIKENVCTMPPKSAIKEVYDRAGGVLNAQSFSEVPRDRRQAYNAKSCQHTTSGIASNHSKDLVYDILEQRYGSLKSFVRNVSFDDSVMCVLSTDQQLLDIERFCANSDSLHNSVLGLDPTFNLGDFFVTVTTYENLILRNRKTGKHPVFIGPMLVHQRRTYETYYYFASELLKLRGTLTSLNAVGTDGEEQLRKAFGTIFPGAIKLLCSVHKRDNIKMKLRQLGVSEPSSKQVLDSIFGYQVGSTFYTGLIDAEDAHDFDDKMAKLKQVWEDLCPEFYQWFQNTQVELFCSSMIQSVRSCAGLGSPPQAYTTNNNESINSLLKHKIQYKKQEWPQFNSKMYDLVMEQQEEFKKAICGSGEYELCDEYKDFEVPHSQWLKMTPEQREVKIDRVMKVRKLTNASGDCSSSSTSFSVEEEGKALKKLSVDWNCAHITHIQPDRVAKIWEKAEEILNTPGLVLPAAGNSSARQVASVGEGASSKSVVPPHFVYSKKSGQAIEVHCDCPMYRSTPNICHHALAGAEDMNCLEKYVMWVRKTKSSGLNLSTLISKEVPKAAGKKGSTSRRKGAPKGKKKLIAAVANGISSPNLDCSDSSSSTIAQTSSTSQLDPFPPSTEVFSPTSPVFSPSPTFSPFSPNLSSSWMPLLDCSSRYVSPSYNYNFSSYSPFSSNAPIFRLRFLKGTRIRSCYGCGNPIRSDTTYVPPPPHDIVVSYKERRYYRDPATQELRLTQNEENTYYHCMLRCVNLKHPSFIGSMLEIDETRPSLQPVHFMHLYEQFGIY